MDQVATMLRLATTHRASRTSPGKRTLTTGGNDGLVRHSLSTFTLISFVYQSFTPYLQMRRCNVRRPYQRDR